MTALTPVQTKDREIFMDVLRGFAILGIFIANLGGFSWYGESAHEPGTFIFPRADDITSFLHQLFIEGKFYSIFSLLFGWGIALQFKRAEDKGINAAPVVRRRLLFMLLLGACHLLIWAGDIVFFYALLGFLLFPLRKLSNKTLLITGAVLVLSPILLYALKMNFPVLNRPADWCAEMAMKTGASLSHVHNQEEFMNILQHGSWWDQLVVNISGFFFRYNYLFFVSRIPKVLGMFLIGYVIGRSEFFKNIQQYKKIVYAVVIGGLLIGLPANYMLAHYMSKHGSDYWQLKTNGLYQTIAYALGVAPLALAYTGIFMLAFQSAKGKKRLSILAPVGKMAFSNYIFQTLVGSFVFLGPGLGYMGKVGPFCYTIFGVIVFIFQIILSTIWLRYFNYGPLEWLWRSATYKKWQPMRKRLTIND